MKRDPPAAQHPGSVWWAQPCLIPLPLIGLLSRKQREQKPQNTLLCSPPAVSGRPLWLGGGYSKGMGWGGGGLGPLKGKGTIRGRLREEVPSNDPEHFEKQSQWSPWEITNLWLRRRRQTECVWAAQERRCSDVIRVSTFNFWFPLITVQPRK